MNKKYDEEFKKEIVYEYQKGATLTDIFKNYGVPKSTVTVWIKKYSEECHYSKPQTKENNISSEELRALNRKIAELEKENNFLKKAAAFFAKEID